MGGTEPDAAAPRPPWPGGAAWIDGRYCPIDEAKISGASMRVSQVVRIPSQSVDPSVKNYHWLDLDRYWASHDEPRYSTPSATVPRPVQRPLRTHRLRSP